MVQANDNILIKEKTKHDKKFSNQYQLAGHGGKINIYPSHKYFPKNIFGIYFGNTFWKTIFQKPEK